MPRRARISTSNLLWSSVVVAVAAFGLGFALSYDASPPTDAALPASTTTVTRPQPTTNTSSSTPPPTSSSTTVPTTAPPTTPPETPPTSPATVAPPVTNPSTTAPLPVPTSTTAVPATPPPRPGELVVSYPRDSRGNMAIRAGTTAAIVLQNVGGSPVTFTVNSVGPVTVGSGTSAVGAIGPGQVQNVGVTASATQPFGDGPHASVAVFTGAGLVVSIPVAIWSS